MTVIAATVTRHMEGIPDVLLLFRKLVVMRKVVMVLDGKHFSTGAFQFVLEMNETDPILLVGLFVPGIEFTDILYSMGGMVGPLYGPEIYEEEASNLAATKAHFKMLCERHGLEYRVHAGPVGDIVHNIKTESRYADMVVIGSELFFSNLGGERRREYLTHVLHEAECPVVAIPENWIKPETLVVSYDGSPSSVFALKQFAYLLPSLAAMKTIVFNVSLEGGIPELDLLAELAGRHYPNLEIRKLTAEPSKYFATWLADNKLPFVISGAYARSYLSEIVQKSFVEEVITDFRYPVFVAHR